MSQDEIEIEVEMGSGNVFADLGLPDPEERQFKSLLAMQIRDIIEHQGLNQKEAAQTIGIASDEMNSLQRGRLSGFSVGQLIKCLNRLGSDVEVRIAPREHRPEDAALTVIAA